jgi:hypothetical protein
MDRLKGNWKTYSIFSVMICGLAALTFGDLSTHLLDSDDHKWIKEIPAALQNPSAYFNANKHMPVRPPVDLLFAAGYLIWGENAGAFHMCLVGLHVLVALLMAYALRTMGLDLALSMLAATLFLMNGTHFRAVHWINIYNHVLAALFALGVLIFYARFLASKNRRWLMLTLIAFILAIFSHPSTVSLSLFLLYFTWRKTGSFRQSLVLGWPLVSTAVLGVFVTYAVSLESPQSRGIFDIIPDPVATLSNLFWFVSRLFTNAHGFLGGIGEMPMGWELWAGAAICVLMGLLVWRKVSPLAEGSVWCLITILPFIHRAAEFQFLPVGPSRQLYIPTMGSSLILAYLIWLCGRRIARTWGDRWQIAVAGLISAAVITSSYWALKTCEATSLYLSGRSYIARDQSEIGSDLIARALRHHAQMVPPEAYIRLGSASFPLGIAYTDIFEEGTRSHPAHPYPLMLLGVSTYLLDDPGQWAKGEAMIAKAFEKPPDAEMMRKNLGTLYFNVGLHHYRKKAYRNATTMFQKASIQRPDYALAHFSLANVHYSQNQFPEAIAAYQHAINIQPNYVIAYQHMARAQAEMGKFDEALEALQAGISLDPNRAVMWLLV